MMRASRRRAAVQYQPGSHYLIPPRWTIDKKLVTERIPNDKGPHDKSHRTYIPQKTWFDVNTRYDIPPLEFQQRRLEFYELETRMIWKAFDTPERIPILLNDFFIRGYKEAFRTEWVEAAMHWVTECRYWRTIGISKPFYDNHQLRANCWANNGMDVGRIQFSQAMLEAVKDLELALKRKNQGLDPNYIWDNWSLQGHIDGSPTDYLPRLKSAEHQDPDGIEVTDDEVAPYASHDALKERYAEFINPDPEPFSGAFLLPTHGGITLEDIHPTVRTLFVDLKPDHSAVTTGVVDPSTMRDLMYLSANTELLESAGMKSAKTWEDVQGVIAPLRSANDAKIDAARLLFNTTTDKTKLNRFYEEKCGFPDVTLVNDKIVTGAVLAYLADLRSITENEEWGQPLCYAQLDMEKEKILGDDAFRVYRHIEDILQDKRRISWASRFTGDSQEEKALDFMLQKMGTRATSVTHDANTIGEDFDREKEPIGRTVQRRVLTSDLQPESKKGRVRQTEKSASQRIMESLDYGQIGSQKLR